MNKLSVASPVKPAIGDAEVRAAGGVALHSGAPPASAHTLPHAAHGLFTVLGGTVDAAAWAIVSGGADAAMREAMTAQMSAGGLVRANLARFLWESDDSGWLDGKRDWLP